MFWLPTIFRMGYLVRSSYGEGRQADTGVLAENIPNQTTLLLIQLFGQEKASKNEYVRNMSCKLLTWQTWMRHLPAMCFVEEACEAMLLRFGHRLEVNKQVHSFDDSFIRELH